uniref:ATP synthase complex subunit 8 n=1 Tax=Sphenodon punctatus TaxID=8508 RepID=A0A7U3N1V7_SPHPU|nr:ATP synthase F0 subunit 8 [Sphenodon punctatus]
MPQLNPAPWLSTMILVWLSLGVMHQKVKLFQNLYSTTLCCGAPRPPWPWPWSRTFLKFLPLLIY